MQKDRVKSEIKKEIRKVVKQTRNGIAKNEKDSSSSIFKRKLD